MRKHIISRVREIGLKIVCTFVVFTFIFAIAHPSLALYLCIFDLLWFALLLSSKRNKNRELYKSCLIISVGSVFAFTLNNYPDIHYLCMSTCLELFLTAIAAVEIVIAFIPVKSKKEDIEKHKLYAERQCDLNRLKERITEMELVGINAPWGMGKSFVLEYLKKDAYILEHFEIIQIDLLACNLDKVELILIEELDKVFRKNRIHSMSSSQLKGLLGKDSWGELIWKLLGTEAFGLSASMDGFKKDLDKLDKKVLIIFDDVDRITDKITIKKVFAISEKLSCNNLHVIFQYDIHVLNKMGFTREYLEKYIPYDISLTEVPYDKLVEAHWEETMSDACPIAIKDVIAFAGNDRRLYPFSQWLGGNFELAIDLGSRASPRKVKNFLTELNITILSNPEFQKQETKETVLKVIFIKHFFASYFDLLTIGESPLDTLKLTCNGADKTLSEVLAECARFRRTGAGGGESEETKDYIRQLLVDSKSREMMAILFLLDYELEIETLSLDLGERIAEPAENLRKKEKNERIDRIVWNVIANGTSELTDNANAIRKLKEEVLSKKGDEQKRAWENYQCEMYNGQLRNGNRTIFRIGIDYFLLLFRGMMLSNATKNDWDQFLDFYFAQYQEEYDQNETPLSRSVVDCCNYCNWNNRSNFFRIVNFFNKLKVVSNFNQEKSYQVFFEKSMQAICHYGYCKNMESWMFQLPGKVADNIVIVEKLLTQLTEDLKENRQRCPLDFIQSEYDTIICFVEKNAALISCKNNPRQRGPSINIKEEMHWAHQDEIDRLQALRENVPIETFLADLEASYKGGKISLLELRTICDKTLDTQRSTTI